MARVKVEVRRGLLSPGRLQSVFCNSGGFYLHLLERKPFGKDFVLVVAKYSADAFGVERRTLRAWLDELTTARLVRFHRGQNCLCVHIEKAGDHTGNEWVPIAPTHVSEGTPDCHPESNPEGTCNCLPNYPDGTFDVTSEGTCNCLPGGVLTIAPRILSPENLPQAADPPRASPHGSAAEAEHLARMIAEAEAAGLDRLAESLRLAAGDES